MKLVSSFTNRSFYSPAYWVILIIKIAAQNEWIAVHSLNPTTEENVGIILLIVTLQLDTDCMWDRVQEETDRGEFSVSLPMNEWLSVCLSVRRLPNLTQPPPPTQTCIEWCQCLSETGKIFIHKPIRGGVGDRSSASRTRFSIKRKTSRPRPSSFPLTCNCSFCCGWRLGWDCYACRASRIVTTWP